ncbi:MAG: GntR family transcriptional regulator [Deferrisomatales bacterium]|nr:GntR family transcriptional regulator [Deferrisomatales bacterium]
MDKASHLPAYVQLAQTVRQSIADESYPSGSRLPSESALAKSFGVSVMTARQAVSVLAEEGLVERVQGSGTFVRRVQMARSHFTLEALYEVLARPEELEVKILKAGVEEPGHAVIEQLRVQPGTPTIVVERLLLHRGRPFVFQVAISRFDPRSPIVETMLDSAVLTGLLSDQGRSSFKKGELQLLPTALDAREANLLGEPPGAIVFRLEHLFFDFSDRPAAFGWLLISPRRMPLISRVGVWDE